MLITYCLLYHRFLIVCISWTKELCPFIFKVLILPLKFLEFLLSNSTNVVSCCKNILFVYERSCTNTNTLLSSEFHSDQTDKFVCFALFYMFSFIIFAESCLFAKSFYVTLTFFSREMINLFALLWNFSVP